jgi:hypothetical protein
VEVVTVGGSFPRLATERAASSASRRDTSAAPPPKAATTTTATTRWRRRAVLAGVGSNTVLLLAARAAHACRRAQKDSRTGRDGSLARGREPRPTPPLRRTSITYADPKRRTGSAVPSRGSRPGPVSESARYRSAGVPPNAGSERYRAGARRAGSARSRQYRTGPGHASTGWK